LDEESKKNIIDELIHNGIIAKITASVVIMVLSIQIMLFYNSFNSHILLPVISAIIGSAMTFLFVKKDGDGKNFKDRNN